MIVNKSEEGIHIILHEAHGLLAGKIANEIEVKYRPVHWFETLIAVCEHDDRQLDFDETNYLSELGVPLDFTEGSSSVADGLMRMKRTLKSARNKSAWVRLLISYHLEFLNLDLAGESKQIKDFLKNEEKERHESLKQFGVSDKKARAYYEFLRFCDRLSLILCKDEAPEANRLLEINSSINGEKYFIKKTENDELVISPWIFSSTKFELSVEERILKETKFSSSKAFEIALMDCIPQSKKWTLIKAEE